MWGRVGDKGSFEVNEMEVSVYKVLGFESKWNFMELNWDVIKGIYYEIENIGGV